MNCPYTEMSVVDRKENPCKPLPKNSPTITKLEDLTPKTTVKGIVAGENVTVIYVAWYIIRC
jgi:hypothetical protein